MSASYRPYWRKHPVQRRVFSVFLLLTLPLWAIPVSIWACWDELTQGWGSVIRELLQAAKP